MIKFMKVLPATERDCIDLLSWRNDLLTRKMSVSTKIITMDQHSIWLSQAISDPHQALYIGIHGEEKIGVCRFMYSCATKSAEVSINLNPLFRGMGLAYDLLKLSLETYGDVNKCQITATIRRNNAQSMRLFKKCNFQITSNDKIFNYYLCNTYSK